METNAELFDYGIHNEASNIRAHVAPLAALLYVFPTRSALGVMLKYPIRFGFQSGVNGATAKGHLVPPSAIPNMRRLAIRPERLSTILSTQSLKVKGDEAVLIVSAFLKAGRFPLWLEGEFITEQEIQIQGTDISVRGRWKIEVKCDFRASDEPRKPVPECSGNLFLQIAERNPLKIH